MPSHLILGGRRSGKSAFAEAEALALKKPLTYIATSRAYDKDHAERINLHRQRRQGEGWTVHESGDPTELQGNLNLASGAVLVDCLSMWLNNIFLDNIDIPPLTLPVTDAYLILVSTEVGLGIHSETSLGRRYADKLGELNQSIAAQADKVSFVAAGLNLKLKG